jgi:thiamine-phosphate pyrophosphorylase
MNAAARIIDANANRAREALRVMEEAARFLLDDAELTADLKTARHELAAALGRLEGVTFHRDTPGDVGTAISTDAERSRASVMDVAVAGAKRLSEALRAMEEYGKTLDALFASRIERIRYRGYDLELRLIRALGTGVAKQWRCCVLITESQCAKPWRDVVAACIDGGADCIQVREKHMEGGALLDRTRAIINIVRPSGLSVIVNDRLDVALAAGADGVHMGTHDLPIVEARKIAGRALLIGASTHNVDEAAEAVEAGADYCGVGAMFNSSLKPERIPSGPAYLRAFIERHPRTPHLAIGGISADNIGKLVDAGCRGVAVSTAVCGADDPHSAVSAIVHALPEPDSP